MSDAPETLDDAITALRRYADLGCADRTDIYAYCDRIEAAVKRERAITDIMLAVKDKPLPHPDPDNAPPLFAAPGNAAALREALESIEDDCHVLDRKDMWEEEGECYYDAIRDIREKVSAALAAPARNCDRFATAEEAVAAFADHLRAWENAHGICSEYPDHAVKVPAGAFAWLFDKAEGGAE